MLWQSGMMCFIRPQVHKHDLDSRASLYTFQIGVERAARVKETVYLCSHAGAVRQHLTAGVSDYALGCPLRIPFCHTSKQPTEFHPTKHRKTLGALTQSCLNI